MNNQLPLLQTMNLAAGYVSGAKKLVPIAGPLAVDIHAGQLICLLGPNGSGKSTLLMMLARALAQDTPLMMLDEPTAHLDLPSRIQLMRLLHQLARQTNKGILVSTHELDLALQVADQVWLLQTGGRLSSGTPEDLVLNG